MGVGFWCVWWCERGRGLLQWEAFRLARWKKTPTVFHTTCTHPGYCTLADAMADLPGFHVTGVERSPAGMRLQVESDPRDVFCPACGVQAVFDGRQTRLLHDIHVFGVPVILVWARRTYRCRQVRCRQVSWGEENRLSPGRRCLTHRALTWAVDQLLTRDVSVSALAHDLQVGWNTLWDAIERPLKERLEEAQ